MKLAAGDKAVWIDSYGKKNKCKVVSLHSVKPAKYNIRVDDDVKTHYAGVMIRGVPERQLS